MEGRAVVTLSMVLGPRPRYQSHRHRLPVQSDPARSYSRAGDKVVIPGHQAADSHPDQAAQRSQDQDLHPQIYTVSQATVQHQMFLWPETFNSCQCPTEEQPSRHRSGHAPLTRVVLHLQLCLKGDKQAYSRSLWIWILVTWEVLPPT